MTFKATDLEQEPLTVRMATAVQITGLSGSPIYEIIKVGELETVKVGCAALLKYASLKAFLRASVWVSRYRLLIQSIASAMPSADIGQKIGQSWLYAEPDMRYSGISTSSMIGQKCEFRGARYHRACAD